MLEIYTLNNFEEWDKIVKTFREHDVYYLSGYVKAFKIHGDGEPLLFYYHDNKIKGINVVMKRDISDDLNFQNILEKGKYFDFATPYGYGGWLIEGDSDTKYMFDEYQKWCIENNIVSEFVRFHPVINNYKYSEKNYEVVNLGNTVCMELKSKDDIWNNMTGKNRNVIRKAMKNGIKIFNSRNPEIFMKFIDIYNATMDKDNADKYYYFSTEFYISILNDLEYNSQIFYAETIDEKIIATSIMLCENGYMSYHLSGSLREYQHLAPSNLLLCKAANWGLNNGCKTLHLGGGVGSSDDSLLKFKKAFYKNELKEYFIGKKIYNKEIYDKLFMLRNKQETNFFPGYRGK